MKKTITALVLMFAIYGCSKKVAGNKSKVAETPPIIAPVPPKKEEAKVAIAPSMKAEPVNPTVPDSPTDGEVKPKDDKKKMLLISNGKEVYSVKCSKCHEAHEPKEYSEAKWEKLVEWMAPRAKLEANEKEAVLAYVKYNAKKQLVKKINSRIKIDAAFFCI